MAEFVPIPQPPPLPFFGNVGEFTQGPYKDFSRLADTYGEIYRFESGGRASLIVSTNKLINELCDERRFKKSLKGTLNQVRNGVKDGLFTAHDEEPNWEKAHRILIPAFGPLSIKGMFPDMHDIASQLSMKWARHGAQTPINVSDDFTRLALDTLALCAMDYRFNSYYRDEMHPFIQAMGDFLTESGVRNRRPALAPKFLYRAADKKYAEDIAVLRNTADAVVEARKKNPGNRKDLLNAMLEGVDPTTGEKLDDDNITNQLITFLIAGHETTSGMLSFAFYHLLKNPQYYKKVQQEVDTVIGREPVKVEHLGKLPYIAAVLREALRVNSTIHILNFEAKDDTVLGGKYQVAAGQFIIGLLSKAHLDPVVFGEDATVFKPDRMLDDNFARLNKEFPNCWKPFGNGKRACIGRPFAWQEALLAMAMLFQNFNFSLADPNYSLEIQETLTVKPKGFQIIANLRHDMTSNELEHRLAGKSFEAETKTARKVAAPTTGEKKPMSVLYGSNSGTCEALAQRLAADAPNHGFNVTNLAPLDSANEKVYTDHPFVIITSSYEGQPPSNAAHFVTWIEGLKGKELEGVNYAVFGCGHHDWVQTFQRIPKLIDETLEKRGAQRLVPLGTTDAADRDMFSDFETWEDESLWPELKKKYGVTVEEEADASGGLNIEVIQQRKSSLRQDVEEAAVVDTQNLTEVGSTKKHIEIRLPTGMTYRAGDYLAVLPINPKETIARVFRHFGLSWDASLKIDSNRPTTLPTGQIVSAFDILSAYVELSQPATKKNILSLVEVAGDKAEAEKLKQLAGDDYANEVTSKRVSILDLLEKYHSVVLPLAAYLSMLPPMRVRQYSISSSPLKDPTKLTLTYSLLEQQALSGQGTYLGVATHFLSSLRTGDHLHVAVRQSTTFHLPNDAENTPLICIAAGSGLAPFRGFIQERAAMIGAGRKLAPALLFYGCRSPDDDLYPEQFADWEKIGAVSMRKAYSRASGKSEGCKYVQHRLKHDEEDIHDLWGKGAKIYVCGSKEVGKAVEEVFTELAQTSGSKKHGRTIGYEEAKEYFLKQKNDRYMTDVFD